MQVNSGLRSGLNLPKIYSLFQDLLGSASCQRQLAEMYLRIKATDKVMDYGCGPGAIVEVLPPQCEIVGFDISERYIRDATRNWGQTHRSFTTDLNDVKSKGPYDLAMAIGVLHHLDDTEAEDALSFMYKNLKPGGRLVTFDNVFVEKQNSLARWLISMDRGQNVRTLNGYGKLFENIGLHPTQEIRHDLLRIPYTHVIFQIEKV